MNAIEVTADTIEEAISKGLAELAVGPSQVIVEVLDEPSRGVFGIGARPARVRLQLLVSRPAAPAPASKPERRNEVVDEGDFEEDMREFQEFAVGETTEEDAQVARDVLTELLGKMDVDATISVKRADPQQGETAPWLLDVSGPNMNVLIGRRGETLTALQYITRLIVSRRLQRRANIIVDVAGYKSRRSQQLRKLALRMADQAIEQRRTITLEPMPPHERRIVHVTLRNRHDVVTRSIGEGDSRKVTIVPK